MIARPGAGALAVLWFIAAWAIVMGVLLVILSFQARGFGKKLEAAAGTTT
jgi:uncharacterized membrane protein HdeD (DUF308 family)